MKLKRPLPNEKFDGQKEITKPGTYVVYVREIREPKESKKNDGKWWLVVSLEEVPPVIDGQEAVRGNTIPIIFSWDNGTWDFTRDFGGKGRWNQFLTAFPFLDGASDIDTNQLINQPLKIDVDLFQGKASVQKCWPASPAEAADVADYQLCFK